MVLGDSIDVMVLSTQHLMRKRHEMTDFKQETVARALGIQIDSAKLHDASYDIQLTKEIYNRISSLSFMLIDSFYKLSFLTIG